MPKIYNATGSMSMDVPENVYHLLIVTKIMFPPDKLVDLGGVQLPIAKIYLDKPPTQAKLFDASTGMSAQKRNGRNDMG